MFVPSPAKAQNDALAVQNMRPMKNTLASMLAALSVVAAGGIPAAQAQDLPTKPIHIVVPFTPGGAQDIVGRAIGTKLAERIGIPVIIDNKPGAGGVIAAEAVAKAAPDGGTLLLASGGAISIAPGLLSKLPYDPVRDFASVAMLVDTPMTVAVRTDSPFKTLAELIAAARKSPGKISFASTGNGTITHLTGEYLAQRAGVKMLHVPYRGAGPAITDVLGGQVDFIVTSVASAEAMVTGKKMRVLGTFTGGRIASLQGAPTVAEATGLKGMEVPVWAGLLAPAKTPPAMLKRLEAEVVAVCQSPAIHEQFDKLGALSLCAGAPDLDRMIKADTQRWAEVIKLGGIQE